LETIKHWGISAVMRVATDGGDIYFKAMLCPLFAREPAVTHLLARLFPGVVPKPLTVDTARGWMLLPDFQATKLAQVGEAERAGAFPLLADMQITALNHLEELRAAGAVDRPLATLADDLDGLLADEMAMSHAEAADIEALRAQAPRLRDLCRQLAGYNIPETLAHGDFHTGNTAIRDGQLIVFDWTDAAVSHPFFDLVLLASEQPLEAVAADVGVRHYLERWMGFEPMPRLWEALALALPLAAVYQMVSYQGIMASLEPAAQWENAGGLRYFVKFLLKVLNQT
jgi:aminoglycoside phosphotransferase (APT) family kinase protein